MLIKNPSVINIPSAIKMDCRWGDKRGIFIIMLVGVIRYCRVCYSTLRPWIMRRINTTTAMTSKI